ncbi:hypothetical protein [Methylocystis sp. S23]
MSDQIIPRDCIKAYSPITAPRDGSPFLGLLVTGENVILKWCEPWHCWHMCGTPDPDYDNDEWFGIGISLLDRWAPIPTLLAE